MRATTCGMKKKGLRGDAGEALRDKGEGGVGPLFFDRPVDRERRGAAARGVGGGQGQKPEQMGFRGGSEQQDRMGAPDRIEFLEGGASQSGAEVGEVGLDISAQYTRIHSYSLPQLRIHNILCHSRTIIKRHKIPPRA